jgi:nitrous oxidase accessory protein NosD
VKASSRMLVCAIVGSTLAVSLLAAPAGAAQIACGELITQNTTLTADLSCPGDALAVGADGVTLDLGGHVLKGSHSGRGISVHHHRGVTIKNGTVDDFEIGIELDEVTDTVLRGLDLSHHDLAASLYESANNRVVDNRLASLFGVGVAESTGNLVAGNVVPGWGIGVGIYIYPGSDANVVTHNDVSRFSYGMILLNSTNTAVTHNQSSLNGVDGITDFGSTATIAHNVTDQNREDGIDVISGSVTLTRNSANANGDLGIEAAPGTATGNGNRAAGNGNPAQCTGISCR